MTQDNAIRLAARIARRDGIETYVVVEDASSDEGYDVATDYDIDTYQLGGPIIAAFDAQGYLVD